MARVLFIVATTAALANGLAQASAACQGNSEISIADDYLAEKCKDLLAQHSCIKLDRVYVQDGGDWKGGGTSVEILSQPTDVNPIEPDKDERYPPTPGYRFIYVSDTRKDPVNQHAVIGVLAARYFEGGVFKKVHLFRNAVRISPESDQLDGFVGPYSAKSYAIKLKNYFGSGFSAEIAAWMLVPSYPTWLSDSTEAFLYDETESSDTYVKASMKIRQKTGAVACIPFNVAVDPNTTSIRLRVFNQKLGPAKFTYNFIVKYSQTPHPKP